jgi:hypothetical protein
MPLLPGIIDWAVELSDSSSQAGIDTSNEDPEEDEY